LAQPVYDYQILGSGVFTPRMLTRTRASRPRPGSRTLWFCPEGQPRTRTTSLVYAAWSVFDVGFLRALLSFYSHWIRSSTESHIVRVYSFYFK